MRSWRFLVVAAFAFPAAIAQTPAKEPDYKGPWQIVTEPYQKVKSVVRHRRIDSKLGERAAQRLDADRRNSGHCRDPIGPGAGRVDQYPCREIPGLGLELPVITASARGGQRRVQHQLGACLLGARQGSGVETGDVDIGATRLPHRQVPFGAQAGDALARVDQRKIDAAAGELLQHCFDLRALMLAPDMQ